MDRLPNTHIPGSIPRIIYQCTRCGRDCIVADLSHPSTATNLPLMARDSDDKPICDICVANEARKLLREGKPVVCYVLPMEGSRAFDGKLTTWGGTIIGYCVTRYKRSTGMRYWTGTVDGIRCWGRCLDWHMSTTAHPYRHQ